MGDEVERVRDEGMRRQLLYLPAELETLVK